MQKITFFIATYYNFFVRNRLNFIIIGTNPHCSSVDHKDMDIIMPKNPLDFQGVIHHLLMFCKLEGAGKDLRESPEKA